MKQVVSIGNDQFESIRQENTFYVDKTAFIKKWWESQDKVTLIARPRRFGKSLNMSMLNCFFSVKYKDRSDLFEGLSIWKEENYRSIQGTYPVLFLSFASIKANNYEDVKKQINAQICAVYEENRYLLEGDFLSENEKKRYFSVQPDMEETISTAALHEMSCYLNRYYKKKVVLLLDEYDTPMQEAYLHGYWDEFTAFIRNLFNSTFKTNPYMERGLMTGITRVSKESVFSDLNNLKVITTTSEQYADCFGFTEKEVENALEAFQLLDQKEEVKLWYDGFNFGSCRDIYNPWSITNYLDERKLQAYWASTSSNGLVNRLIRTASSEIKEKMEELLQRNEIIVSFDEQIVFDQLDQDENAIWSLLMACGYLKVEWVEYRGMLREPWYHLQITNLETLGMFSSMFKSWFNRSTTNYTGFMKALIQGDKKAMNYYMNKIALATFIFFDTGKLPPENSEPERFYHGFVLGLIAEKADEYLIRSNRESGFGRYDVMMIPKKKSDLEYPAIIMEFKVHDPEEEKTLDDTVESALKQIREKKYDVELLEQGIQKEQIRHYGFAFRGKEVLIG